MGIGRPRRIIGKHYHIVVDEETKNDIIRRRNVHEAEVDVVKRALKLMNDKDKKLYGFRRDK